MSDEAALLRELVRDGVIGGALAAHVALLADAGVPLVVAGSSSELATRVTDAFAAASPVPGAAESGREIEIQSGHHFEWLADPTGSAAWIRWLAVRRAVRAAAAFVSLVS